MLCILRLGYRWSWPRYHRVRLSLGRPIAARVGRWSSPPVHPSMRLSVDRGFIAESVSRWMDISLRESITTELATTVHPSLRRSVDGATSLNGPIAG